MTSFLSIQSSQYKQFGYDAFQNMSVFQNQLLKDSKKEKVFKDKLHLKHANQMSRQKNELLRWSEKCVGAVDKVSGSNDIQPKEEKKLFQLFCPQRPLLQVV